MTITYYAKDDTSGVGCVNYRLVDPTGKTFFEYHYHDNFYTTFFKSDPTVYKKYVIRLLPRGSVLGIWGLYEMNINDKGGDTRNDNFTEVLYFTTRVLERPCTKLGGPFVMGLYMHKYSLF